MDAQALTLHTRRLTSRERVKRYQKSEEDFSLLLGHMLRHQKKVSEEKIATLRKAIARGEYKINIEALSSKLMASDDFLRELFGDSARGVSSQVEQSQKGDNLC